MKKFRFMLAMLLVVSLLVPPTIQAEEVAEESEIFLGTVVMPWEPLKLSKEGETTLTWAGNYNAPEGVTITYEIELADNAEFSNAQKFVSDNTSLTLNKSVFGTNGGKFYVRIRFCASTGVEPRTYGEWSEPKEQVFVKINKKNFPGIYKILKNGSKQNNRDLTGYEKVTHDKNGDGWMDPSEINQLLKLSTVNESKKKNGKYYVIKAPKVNSLKGIEYLTELSIIHLSRYSGTKVELSKNKITFLNLTGVTSKQITVIAPDATSISIQPEYGTKLKKIDVSRCDKVVDLLVYGSKGTKTLKLPKEKKQLKVLSTSDLGVKALNLNAYKNLQQLYVYNSKVKNVKVNKCKNLRYIYFYFCSKIKSLNLKSNKKLRGADFYQSSGLTNSSVKKPKGAKVTWNKGKWWYSTKAYKKDMKKLY